jgi:capsular polysaccharide export protein
MRVLYFESPYSRFYARLNNALKPTSAHTLLFNLGYLVYSPSLPIVFVKNALKKIKPDEIDYNLVKNTISLVNCKSREPSSIEFEEMARYAHFLKYFLVEHRIDCCICYNDLRWQHAIAKSICKQMNINIWFFEEGQFRPTTITLDNSGINHGAQNTISKILEQPLQDTKNKWNDCAPTFFDTFLKYLLFVCFLIGSKIGDLLSLNTCTKNKKYSLKKYTLLAALKLKSIFSNQKISNRILDSKHLIVVPLQVNEDSQTQIYSPFYDSQQVIDLVESAISILPKDIQKNLVVVFRKHPMALSQKCILHSPNSVFSNAPTVQLITKCKVLITVNSTVALDGLVIGKPVLFLGQSVYTLINNTKTIVSKEEISQAILDILNNVTTRKQTDIQSKIEKLKFNYQINSNFYSRKSNLNNVIDRIQHGFH